MSADSERCFNPRAREGRDTHAPESVTPDGAVSIHAPARGATCGSSASKKLSRSFNPRAREGRDRALTD